MIFDPYMQSNAEEASLVLPDGMPLVRLGRRIAPHAEVDRCYGPDLMMRMCRAGVCTT